jgi:hypothetical protein
MPAPKYRAADVAVDGFVAIACRRIVPGDGPFVDFMAKLTVNVINRVDGGVRISETLSLCVE